MSGKIKSKRRRATPLFAQMSVMMAVIAVLQLLTFFLVLFASGEFSTTRQFAHSFLTEKTSNRGSYIENYLNQRSSHVEGYAASINRITAEILQSENKSASAIAENKELSRRIIAESAAQIISMCRTSVVNDAFIYLNTGSLYDSDGSKKLTGFYIRDMDSYSENTDNSDLLLEMGNADIARSFGITMDSEWSLYSSVTDSNDFAFYYDTLNSGWNDGVWSGFSRISRSASSSMKYTRPLILSDGTVYGVVGIGLLEKSIMSNVATNDLFNDAACYILALDTDNNGIYEYQAHTGAAYSRLVTANTVLDKNAVDEYGMLKFNTNIDTVGSYAELKLYSQSSPFSHQKWALISVAEKSAILEIYNKLVNLFIISAAISLVIGVVIAILVSRLSTQPVSAMRAQLENVSENGEIVHFVSTNISEFDLLADSIVDLQIKVRKQASRVSDILSISGSGIGTFMYDKASGSVFVGKSLLNILDFPGVSSEEDFTIPFVKFREYLSYFDKRYRIFDNEIFTFSSGTANGINIDTEYDPDGNGINSKWFRFSFTKDENVVMGLVQDITDVVHERRKIEHERDFDVTTDIYNRRAFYRRVEELFTHPEKLGTAAFMMMDLDNLKFVNDTFGHEYGDRYIRAAADALKTLTPKNGIVARLSGDEFIACIYGGGSKDDIRAVIEEFKTTLSNSRCLLADGSAYKVRASGGIAWYPDNSQSYEQLIKYADFSMYTIKHSTKGVFAEFDESIYLNDSILITGIQELNRIIDSNDIRFAYQPIIRVNDGYVFGYDALMCPHSETIKTISDLLRIAKSGAKLYEIERLTFFLGLASFSRLIESGMIPEDTHLFLNSISECMLDERAFKGIEENYRPILKNIVLENLDVDQHDDELIEKKQEIVSKWGGMTALDNFGNGHNNESTMFNINPNMIIIDRNLINGCDVDEGKYTVIRNLVHLTRDRGIIVAAQGVENDDELRTVIALGVDLVQGYFLAKPEFEPQPVPSDILDKIAEYRRMRGAE